MRLYRVALISLALVPLLLSGCAKTPSFVAKEEPWRADRERDCLSRTNFAASPFVTQRASLGGPSVCGALRPYDVSASSSGRVSLKPAATLQCSMLPAVDHWIATVVEPAARRYFGANLVEIKVAASYSCRPRNGIWGERLSEHGHANAIDIAQFYLSDGTRVSVKEGWNGSSAEQAFLREVHSGACRGFTTVLGPNADSYHRDHFHMDLARHGRDGTYRVCK